MAPAVSFEQYKALAELYRLLFVDKESPIKTKIVFERKYPKLLSFFTAKDICKRSLTVQFTDDGLAVAYRTARIFTVMKAFCQDILELSQKETDEHIRMVFEGLTDPVIEHYCSLIGHARKEIVPGECCRRAKIEVSEKIIPLSRLPVNTPARIMYVKTTLGATMVKLFDLGLYPGKTVRIHQLYPAYIVVVDQQEIALESAVAEVIFVKK
jgi:DtxR family transcriptional regulator, Mn-dependent transcriptional regulator